MIGPSVTDAQLFASLRGFLASILPDNTPIIRAQVNRVASPVGDFVMMTALRRVRLATNINVTVDTQGQGSIAGTTLTMFNLTTGSLAAGSLLFGAVGTPLLPNTRISDVLTGSGGPGTYTVGPSQSYAPGMIYAGTTNSLAKTEVTLQLDIFGPRSAESAQIITTLLRDEFGTHYFDVLGLPIQTLYASDPRQMPFIDAETQYENRWIVESVLQANIEVDSPMQFADVVTVAVPPPVDAFVASDIIIPGLALLSPSGAPIVNPAGEIIVTPG